MVEPQDISTAPKDGTNVLLYFPNKRAGYRWGIGRYHDTVHTDYGNVTWEFRGWFDTDLWGSKVQATHWLPLPPEMEPTEAAPAEVL